MGSKRDVRDALAQATVKAFLASTTTGEAFEFLFNPAELKERFAVNWTMHESIGLSHKRPQFRSSENVVWRFTAFFDQLQYQLGKPQPPRSQTGSNTLSANLVDDDAGAGGATEVEDFRKFVMSLAVPRRVTSGGRNRILAASPTPIHFEWPGMVSTTVRLHTAEVNHVLFQVGTARPRVYSIDFDVFEDPAERIYADDVRRVGTLRPWAASQTPKKV